MCGTAQIVLLIIAMLVFIVLVIIIDFVLCAIFHI